MARKYANLFKGGISLGHLPKNSRSFVKRVTIFKRLGMNSPKFADAGSSSGQGQRSHKPSFDGSNPSPATNTPPGSAEAQCTSGHGVQAASNTAGVSSILTGCAN